MAIVQVKNPDLYRQWLAYYRLIEGKSAHHILTPLERTQAFFNSEASRQPPKYI